MAGVALLVGVLLALPRPVHAGVEGFSAATRALARLISREKATPAVLAEESALLGQMGPEAEQKASSTGHIYGGCERAPVSPQTCGGFTLAVEELAENVRAAGGEVIGAPQEGEALEGAELAALDVAVDEVGVAGWWKKVLPRTCLGQHPEAIKTLYYNYGLGYAALGLAYAVDDNDEFPFDYAAATLALGAYWAERACRTHAGGGPDPHETDPTVGFWRNYGRKYVAHVKMVPIEMATLVFFSAAEDYLRGKPVLDPEYLKKYGMEAAFIGVWDASWGNLKAIAILNPLYLRVFPGWARAINGRMEALFGGSELAVANWMLAMRRIPGMTIDSSLRVSVRSADTFTYLNSKDAMTHHQPGAAAGGEAQQHH